MINVNSHTFLMLAGNRATSPMITLGLCMRLHNVITSLQGRFPTDAEGNTIVPVARCTSCITFSLLFSSCCYGVITGWDFLCENPEVTTCAQPRVLLSVLPTYNTDDAAVPINNATRAQRYHSSQVDLHDTCAEA